MFNKIRGIKKRWFVVAASIALLSIGLVGGSVFAAGSGPSGVLQRDGDFDLRGGRHHGGSDTVLNRVAELLGKSRTELDSAFATALDEQANTKFEEYVQGLEDDDTLTADQATAANHWFDERPSNSGPLALRLARTSDSDRVDTALEKLVEKERITQDEADTVSDWHDDRPDSLPTVTHEHGKKRHGHHGDGDSDS